MERTVFIPHLPTRQNPVDGAWVPTISLNPAAELGDLNIICDHPSDASPENLCQAPTQKIWAAALTSHYTDYILMAGDPVLCAIAIHAFLQQHAVANVLRWNRDERKYELLKIEE